LEKKGAEARHPHFGQPKQVTRQSGLLAEAWITSKGKNQWV
jgi:hypothetical protein